MDRKEILQLEEKELLKLINKKFNIEIQGFEDKKYLAQAWLVVEKLMLKGWRIDIETKINYKKVDGILMTNGRPETVFAQYGRLPKFNSVIEGICKLALIILAEE